MLEMVLYKKFKVDTELLAKLKGDKNEAHVEK